MTDPKIDIKQFASQQEHKVEAWLGTNLVPLAVGLILGIIAGYLIHLL